MVRFKAAMRGYDKREVDEYIHKTTEFYESKIRELEECIERLKEENDYLYAKNADYRRNEERVSSAIMKAMEVKSSIEEEYRAKVSLEEDRLNVFKEKWVTFAAGIHRSNADRVLDQIDDYIRDFRNHFTIKANKDISVTPKYDDLSPSQRSYLKEQERIHSVRNERVKEKMSAASLVDDTSATALDSTDSFIED